MKDEFKKIGVPLDWVQIDNIIVGMRVLKESGIIDKKFAVELEEYLEPYSMKAKTQV